MSESITASQIVHEILNHPQWDNLTRGNKPANRGQLFRAMEMGFGEDAKIAAILGVVANARVHDMHDIDLTPIRTQARDSILTDVCAPLFAERMQFQSQFDTPQDRKIANASRGLPLSVDILLAETA